MSSLNGTGTSRYISGSKVRQLYDIAGSTLRLWANEGKIRCARHPDGRQKRIYLLEDIENLIGIPEIEKANKAKRRISVIYARVSSAKQINDLQRQITDLQSRYPEHKLYKDVASGLNFKRKGFQTLLEQVLDGNIEEVVVMHRDRLCRFAIDLVEFIFKKTDTRLVVLGKKDEHDSHDELAEDLLAVTTVFVAKNNGIRAAENRKRRRAENEKTKNNKDACRETKSRKITEMASISEERTHSNSQ